jgi:predicted site-specific integrase-resolvase
LLTVVCRPLSGVLRWDARPDGSDEEAGNRGITLDATVTGVGSGVTGDRARLGKVLADPQVSGIVVEHRDRLARFGVERRRAEAGVRCVTAEVVEVVAQ